MFKHQRVSFYMTLVAAVCGLVALALFAISNATVGYPIVNAPWAMAAMAAAFIFCAGSVFAQEKNVNEFLVSLLRVASIFLMMAALTILLSDRAVVAGGVFTWNDHDAYAWRAFYTGMACLGFQLVSVLLLVIGGCMKQGKAA